ncbi:MAG TPA: hypothetical protein VFZ83_02760 [Acidimicrobiia bacterium]|nr:hypothetical protein [Acidimicrobiia bacterium]
MIKRLFWLVVGFVLGVGSSFAVVRRLRRAAARYAPPEVAQRWGRHARGIGHDVRAALDEGRSAMRSREAELRAGIERPRHHREGAEVGQ